MKADEFLESPSKPKKGVIANDFLEGTPMFAGGQPGDVGVGGEFPYEKRWWHKPVEWLTAGHISHEPAPLPEVTRDPITGEIVIINEPETAAMSIFEEPTGIPLAATIFGAAGPAVSGLIPRTLRAAREGVGWMTGGATEAPALAKAGVKAIPKLTEGISAKQLEKTMAKAAEKPLFGQVPEKVVAKEVSTGIGAMPAKAVESEVLKGQFAERFLTEKPIKKKGPKYPLTIMTKHGEIYKSDKALTHSDLLTEFDVKPNEVVRSGMFIEGKPVWEGKPKEIKVLSDKQAIELKRISSKKIKTPPAPKFVIKEKPKLKIVKPKEKPYSYGGEGYKVKLIKETEKDAQTKWSMELSQDNKNILSGLIKDVEGGQPGTKIKMGYGIDEQWIGVPSTYPEFMRDQGWTKNQVVSAFNNALEGKPLGIKQAEIVETAIEHTQEIYRGMTVYSGIPIHKAGKIWTKSIGEPIWDKAVMKGIPKLLEKVPGGKSVNRAFIYDYRGDLPDTAKYISSMEDMKRAQSIGREYAVDLGKRLQSLPEDAQLRMGEYIRGEISELKAVHEKTLADEAKLAMLDLGKQAVDTGLLSEKTFFKNAGKYMPRLYTSKEYQSLLTRYNLTKPNRLDLSRFKKRKDIPKEIRQEMGEILTPGYPIAKGITQLTHDIELARFFNGIASNKEWALTKSALKVESKEGLVQTIPEGWKQLPSNKKLGSLSEGYVHPEIFADLQETIRVMETPERIWRKSLGAWKFGKVIVSPKTHARNLLSNSVLAHLGGLPMYEQPFYLAKAAKELRSKGSYWKAIRQEGGLEHTFTAGELNALFDQVEGQMKGMKANSLAEKMGVIGNAWSVSKKGLRKAADLYQAEEQWFKMAKFIHNIERKGMNHKAAWKDAEKWLFNYAKVTKFQEKYRSRWYGAPFATFTFKAMPRIAEAMIKTPWRFALPSAMIYGLEEAARKTIGDTRDQIKAKKELRPEWMKGQMLGVPNFARVPIVDEQGREYYLNLTYILPWGDIGEAGKWGPIPGGIMPFSQPFVKEPMQQILNYDAFWKEEIVKEKELAGKTKIGKLKTEAKIRGKHLAQAMLPTPVMDVTKAIDALKKQPDYRGRLKPPKIVAADVIAGIKMYPVDYMEQVAKQIGKIDPKRGWLARKIHGDIRTLSIKRQALIKLGKEPTVYNKQIKLKIKQLEGLGGESMKIGQLYKQLRK